MLRSLRDRMVLSYGYPGCRLRLNPGLMATNPTGFAANRNVSQRPQIFHCRGDFFERVVRLGAADGEVTAILMFFECAQQFGKLRTAAAQGDFDAATGGDVARAVGGMDVHHVSTELGR